MGLVWVAEIHGRNSAITLPIRLDCIFPFCLLFFFPFPLLFKLPWLRLLSLRNFQSEWTKNKVFIESVGSALLSGFLLFHDCPVHDVSAVALSIRPRGRLHKIIWLPKFRICILEDLVAWFKIVLG